MALYSVVYAEVAITWTVTFKFVIILYVVIVFTISKLGIKFPRVPPSMHSISAWARVILRPLKNLMFTRFSLPFSRSACNCRPTFKHFISDWFYSRSLFPVRKILIPSCRYQGLFRNNWNVRQRKLRLFCDSGLIHRYVRFSVRFERTTNFKCHMPK